MTVYVSPAGTDPLRLTADTEDELHTIAAQIHVSRTDYHPTPFPHYRLDPWRRDAAVQAGNTRPRPQPPAQRPPVAPRAGDIVVLTKAASVQFAVRPRLFRVIHVHDWPTYDGWAWIDGYELNPAGDAVERRTVFVSLDGLRKATKHAGRRAA